jgi:diaminopimelate decarboxylase
MHRFEFHDGHLRCEEVELRDLAARFGTPLYVYSADTLRRHLERLRTAFAELDPLICYSVKCCANVHILRLLAECGSGFDVVSGGELYRARLAGADAAHIVFAGVGKTEGEIEAALRGEVGLLNVESESELRQLAGISQRLGVVADVAVRVNPDVDPHTHVYTTTGTRGTKFGLGLEQVANLFRQYGGVAGVRMRGLHFHLGSPVHAPGAYALAIQRALELIERLRGEGFAVDTLDLGGGFGAHYRGGEAPAAEDYAATIVPLLRGRGLRIVLEPGRSIAANSGVLVARVLHVKESGGRRFAIVDAAMTELLRPALYDAYHFVWPVDAGGRVPTDFGAQQPFPGLELCDVVGPVCESGDFLAKDRLLPPLAAGELLAVFTCGAYAMSMASQYNSRPRSAEVLVDGSAVRLIRRRETYADLVAAELGAGDEGAGTPPLDLRTD